MWIDQHIYAVDRLGSGAVILLCALAIFSIVSFLCVFGMGDLFRDLWDSVKSNKIFFLFFAMGCLVFAPNAFTCPGGNPVVTKEGLKIAYLKNDSDGLFIRWEVESDDIVVGEDEFIIKYRDRQIPSRTNYGAQEYEIGRTKELYYKMPGFYRNRDIKISVEVNKELTK